MEKPNILKTITDKVKNVVKIGVVAGVVSNAIPPKAPEGVYTEPIHTEYSYTSPVRSFLNEDLLYLLSSNMTEKFSQKLHSAGYISVNINHIESSKTTSETEDYILTFKKPEGERKVTITMDSNVFNNKYKVEEFFSNYITKELEAI